MNIKTISLALLLAATASLAAADTSLVLKPSAAQLKAAKQVGNKICPVSGEEMGSMGPGKTVIYKGKAVQLCCGSCLKSFAKEPAKFLAKAEQPAKPEAGHEGHDHP